MLLEAQHFCFSCVGAVGIKDVSWAIGGINCHETAKNAIAVCSDINMSPMQAGREKVKGVPVVDTDQYLHILYGQFCSSL